MSSNAGSSGVPSGLNKGVRESAGINRSGVANERVVRERSSQPLGPEPYAGDGDVASVAWVRGTRRPGIQLRNHHSRVPTLPKTVEGNTQRGDARRAVPRRGGVDRGKGLSQEERPAACLAPDTGPDPRQVTWSARRARSCNDFALDSRQEPYEVILHVRICAGGRRKRRSLPRSYLPFVFCILLLAERCFVARSGQQEGVHGTPYFRDRPVRHLRPAG